MAGADQPNVFSGRDPLQYVPSNPLTLFMVQAFIIIVLCRLIQVPLSYLRQPRVIAEIIGGILLGKTAMGRIPHFTETIFPKASMPNITLVANIGLIFFLFMVGMEIDLPYLKRHWKIAASVGVGSIVVPFALGFAVAVGLYKQFHEDLGHQSFGVFGLFIGIAISITALPVLARILTEIGLLHERSGIVVLAAGVTNDIVAWVLLALVISLSHAGSPINTLWILLVALGWFLFLAVLVRPLLHMYLKRKGSIEKGPSEFDITVIILGVFVSSFFTDIIGVHQIFGAFLIGTIIPRENSFPAKVTEKIEDVISAVFMPIYFATSGFNVDFAALSDGATWGYAILIIVISFVGKVVGAAIPAKLLGLETHYAIEAGFLMSCKGLVELVALNIGLEVGILNTKIFSMFVLMAIVTTFVTTPVTLWWRSRMDKKSLKKGRADLGLPPCQPGEGSPSHHIKKGVEFEISKIVLAFDSPDVVPTNMVLTQMLAGPFQLVPGDSSRPEHEETGLSAFASYTTLNQNHLYQAACKDMSVSAVHMVELTDRTADLIQAISSDFIPGDQDPVMKVLSTFSRINRIPFEGVMSISANSERPHIINSLSFNPSDLCFVTWDDFEKDTVTNCALFERPTYMFPAREGLTNVESKISLFSHLFMQSVSNVCAFIDRGYSAPSPVDYRHNESRFGGCTGSGFDRHVVVPFFGDSNDDWLAFGIALYMARNDGVSVTVIVVPTEEDVKKMREIELENHSVSKEGDDADAPAARPRRYSLGIKKAVDTVRGLREMTQEAKKFASSENTTAIDDNNTLKTPPNDHLALSPRCSNIQEVRSAESTLKSQTATNSLEVDTTWATVQNVYNQLPQPLKSKVTVTKCCSSSSNSLMSGSYQSSYDRNAEVDRLFSTIESFQLKPQDLIVTSRFTNNSLNCSKVASHSEKYYAHWLHSDHHSRNDSLGSAADTGNSADNLEEQAAGGSGGTVPSSSSERPGTKRTFSSMTTHNNQGSKSGASKKKLAAKVCLFGEVATELVTSTKLNCSFMVCQSLQSRIEQVLGEDYSPAPAAAINFNGISTRAPTKNISVVREYVSTTPTQNSDHGEGVIEMSEK